MSIHSKYNPKQRVQMRRIWKIITERKATRAKYLEVDDVILKLQNQQRKRKERYIFLGIKISLLKLKVRELKGWGYNYVFEES